MKSFTAIKLIDAIFNNPKESRRESLLNTFEQDVQKSSSNTKFKFWAHENFPILLKTKTMYGHALNYTHYNPVTVGL